MAYEAVRDLPVYKAAPLSLRVPHHPPSMHTYGCVCIHTHTVFFSLLQHELCERRHTLICIPLVPQTVPVRKKHSGITEHVNDQISVLIDHFAISGKLGRPAGKVTLCTKDNSLHWGSGVSTDRRGDVETFWSRVNRSAVG